MKNSEAPSGVKAKKKKNNAAQRMTEMNGEGYGDCCQAEFPSDWPHTFTKELFAMKLKGLLILHVKDSWESFQISEKLFPKCILIRLAD